MNAEEFKTLFLPFGKRFYATAFRMLGGEQDAEDAVQDVFIKLWGMRERLDGVRNPEAFGVTLTRNICIDRLRSAFTRNRNEVRETDDQVQDETHGPSLDDRARIRQIKEFLNVLPERQRRVFELRYFSDCELKEIEYVTGLGAVNIRVILSRTKKMLVERLGKGLAI